MAQDLDARLIKDALDACANEPVHVPGLVQPFGAILGYDIETGIITHVSENADDFLNKPSSALLGEPLSVVFSGQQLHQLRNATAQLGINVPRSHAGVCEINGISFDLHTSGASEAGVIEIEPSRGAKTPDSDLLRELNVLMQRASATENEQALFKTTARMLRALSGYDRVMVYRFDEEFNGEVIAEDRSPRMESFKGLRFPHWDIPPQARDIMREIPLRIIADVDHEPAKLCAATAQTPALDMTHAHLRGVSLVHMQYLRNMDVRASMTLSIVVDGELWGMFAMHGQRPKVPSIRIRQICESFMPYFVAQLKLHHKAERLVLAKDLERLQTKLNEKINLDDDFASVFDTLAPRLITAFDAQGMALISDSKLRTFGETPDETFFEPAVALHSAVGGDIKSYDAIGAALPDLKDTLGSIAGVLSVVLSEEKAIFIFRKNIDHDVNWAGSPAKDIVNTDGNLRLMPRGSFQTYKETVKGKSRPWSARDLDMGRNIWTLLVASERRAMIASLEQAKFKDFMIDELNHRVRNILALVRSVSRKARGHYASLESYSRSLEARIKALAAAHDLGAGASAAYVSVQTIFQMEAEPFSNGANLHLFGECADWTLKADAAPIFALVVHEMVTNAVKYGALSVESGRVEVNFVENGNELVLEWRERNGPEVISNQERVGFGSVLIEQAIPYELGGQTKVRMAPAGVELDITLPLSLLSKQSPKPHAAIRPLVIPQPVPKVHSFEKMTVLVVDDIFMIAAELMDMFETIGFGTVQIASNTADALDYIENDAFGFAALDVNLGGGETSYAIAQALRHKNIPFFFVTGYGEGLDLPDDLVGAPILTKPIDVEELTRHVSLQFTAPDP